MTTVPSEHPVLAQLRAENARLRDDLHAARTALAGIEALVAGWREDTRAQDCAHIWPGELTTDALCERGCGTTYGEWSR